MGNDRFGLANGGEGGAPPEKMEIKPEDVKALNEFLVGRFQGIYPACMFLSAFSGSTIASFAKQKGVPRKDAEDVLAMLHNAITEAFDQVYAKGSN
jgi:hypothetical protein